MKKYFRKYQALLVDEPQNEKQAKSQSLRYLALLFLTLPLITTIMIVALKW